MATVMQAILTASDQELWGEPSRPLGLGPVVVVDTSGPVDIAKLAATVAQELGAT